MHRLIIRHHRLILVLSAVITLVSILLCSRLKLDLNFLSLLPEKHTQAQTFLEVAEKVGLQSMLISVVHPAQAAAFNEDAMEGFVKMLARHYHQSSLIEAVDYHRAEMDLSHLYPVLLGHLPRLLKPQAVDPLERMLTDTEIQNRVRANKKLLMTPFGFAAKQMVLADPLGLLELLDQDLQLPDSTLIQKKGRGYFRTDQGSYLIFIKPVKPPQEISFSKQLMQAVAQMEAAALQEAQATWPGFSQPPAISHTGAYPIAVNDETATKKDIQVALVTSAVGVLTLFGLCFRTLRTLGHVALPLAMSILWTLGLAGLLFGRLNILTCIFSCVLAALGIDFAIHLVNRFYGDQRQNISLADRLEAAFGDAGPGIIIGALTTAAAFFAIGTSDFRGFRELGIMTGTGLLLCLVAMLIVLPALLVRRHKSSAARTPQIVGFGLTSLMTGLNRRPVAILLTAGIIVAGLLNLGTRIGFDDNLKNFRPPDDQILELQDQITRWLGGSSAPTLLVVTRKSEAEAMDAGAAVWRALQPLKTNGQVADVAALQGFLPSPTQQRQTMTAIVDRGRAFDWQRIRDTFGQILRTNGMQPLPAYDGYFNTLSAAFEETAILLPSAFDHAELQRLFKMFMFTSGDLTKAVIYIRPPTDLWSHQDAVRFKQAIEDQLSHNGIGPDQYNLTGPQMLSAELKSLILQNLRTAMILAVIVILVVLLVYYRSFLMLVGALTPLVAALALLAGSMVLLRIEFNFINVIVLPMIVGIGIDDGVHLTNTFRQHGRRYHTDSMARTGRGVVLTSLTTMVGFGSISLSHYPGLQSMGYVAAIGVGACLLTSLFILPPLLTLISRKASQ